MNCLRTILPPPAASDEEQRENDELLSKPAAKKICQTIEWPRVIRLKGTSINAPFPRLLSQRRARILMYPIVTPVLRAVHPGTHKKLTVYRDSLKPVSLTLERHRQNCSYNHNDNGHPVTADEVFDEGEYRRYEKRYSEKM